jgi:S1-C subfamily serine protease
VKAPRRVAAAGVAAASVVLALGCGGGHRTAPDRAAAAPITVQTTRVEVVKGAGGSAGFDPAAVYRRAAPGVVTVISVFGSGGLGDLLGGSGGGRGLGSGFVLDGAGEIATNAHVVTQGQGSRITRARDVYVSFADGNRVPARIVGVDPNADVALLRVDPGGLTLAPLALASGSAPRVGSPVAAIGSPFGEPQSLSVGIVSAVNRSIDSLTSFQIPGAIQTDAAINHGNSGGPLVDARGRVLGINSQIESTGGGGEGVGFAVPAAAVRRSLAQLRAKGHVDYSYLGVSTVEVFPQLQRRFHLPVDHGSWIQGVTRGGPARNAGLKGGTGRTVVFEAQPYVPGGDILTRVAGRTIRTADDLSEAVADHPPGARVTVEYWRGARRRVATVRLAKRPAGNPQAALP